MMQYEYTTKRIEESEDAIQKLNEWGKEGWQAVRFIDAKESIGETTNGVNWSRVVYSTMVVLMRQKLQFPIMDEIGQMPITESDTKQSWRVIKVDQNMLAEENLATKRPPNSEM